MRALLLALALAACAPAAPPAAQPPAEPASEPDPEPGFPQELVDFLPNSNWVMNDEAPNFAPTIQFATDRASGTVGCNTWSADYGSDGIALDFSNISVTERACPADALETQQNFLQTLRDTRGVSTENGEIMFDNLAGEELARFRRLR
jgi:heat shock protein HslJ